MLSFQTKVLDLTGEVQQQAGTASSTDFQGFLPRPCETPLYFFFPLVFCFPKQRSERITRKANSHQQKNEFDKSS